MAETVRFDAPTAAESGDPQAWMDANLRLNDILTVGTHNSYHLRTHPEIFAIMKRAAPETWWHLDYEHPPLLDQLEDGARALELDVIHDPEGGRYAHPMGLTHAGLANTPAYVRAMSQPGLKVLHIQDLDFRSSVFTYIEGLSIIRDWSRAHRRHTPILITMNTNDSSSRTRNGTHGLPFDEVAYDRLDAEVRSVFGPDQLLTPDDVRGDYPTLREAVLARGWPKLGDVRGKVLLAIDEKEAHIAAYRGARLALEGRACFVNVDEDSPMAGYITLNENKDVARIRAAVEAGFLVRTRADSETIEARSGDTTRRDAALASGAQWVSTDYRRPEPGLTDYCVRLPGDAITVENPVRAAGKCARIPIE